MRVTETMTRSAQVGYVLMTLLSSAGCSGGTEASEPTSVVGNALTQESKPIEAVSWGANRIDLFSCDAEKTPLHKYYDGTGWSAWEPLPGTLTAPPSAVSWGVNRVDVFVDGTDQKCYHKALTGSTWSPNDSWEDLGGRFEHGDITTGFVGQFSSVSWGADRLDIFGRDGFGRYEHKTWNGAWSPSSLDWELLDHPSTTAFASDPSAVTWGPNRLDVFGLGDDGNYYYNSWTGSGWSGWNVIPSNVVFIGKPAVVSWGANRIDVFGQADDGNYYHRAFDGLSWFPSQWEAHGGPLRAQPTVVSWRPNRIDLFGQGTTGNFYHQAWDGTQWLPSLTAWEEQGSPSSAKFGSAPTVVSWGANRLDVYGVDQSDEVWTHAWDGTSWIPFGTTGWYDLGGPVGVFF